MAGTNNHGSIEFSYHRADGVHITEVRTIDMDAYVASNGGNITPLQSTAQSICDPVVLPTVPVFPPPAPPPGNIGLPPSTGMVDLYQLPVGGEPGWYQRVRYTRPVYPQPDGTWDPPGEWGNPLVTQVRGQIPNARCETMPE
jgi:hypothetical protein